MTWNSQSLQTKRCLCACASCILVLSLSLHSLSLIHFSLSVFFFSLSFFLLSLPVLVGVYTVCVYIIEVLGLVGVRCGLDKITSPR